MRGVGGPLLCIGDLLADIGTADDDRQSTPSSISSPTVSNEAQILSPSHLHHLFEVNYDQLSKALTGTEPTDHSWTVLTLKLCSALETADKLVQSANTNIGSLTEKIEALESIIKRGDSIVQTARVVHDMQKYKAQGNY